MKEKTVTIQEALKQLEKTIEDHVNREATRRAMEAFRLLQPGAKPNPEPVVKSKPRGRPKRIATRAPYGSIKALEPAVVAHIKGHPGATVAEIAHGIGRRSQDLYSLMSRLRATRQVVAHGEPKNFRYYAHEAA